MFVVQQWEMKSPGFCVRKVASDIKEQTPIINTRKWLAECLRLVTILEFRYSSLIMLVIKSGKKKKIRKKRKKFKKKGKRKEKEREKGKGKKEKKNKGWIDFKDPIFYLHYYIHG